MANQNANNSTLLAALDPVFAEQYVRLMKQLQKQLPRVYPKKIKNYSPSLGTVLATAQKVDDPVLAAQQVIFRRQLDTIAKRLDGGGDPYDPFDDASGLLSRRRKPTGMF